jgi:amino acid adenylation domain-containing protein
MSGQEDIIIGTPTAGRRHADLEKIIGMFVNTIALRNLPKGDQTITEFINAVKERTLESFENQEYQFEDLVEKLDIKRDPGRNPIFDVMIVLQNIGEPGAERAGEGYKIETMKFDLSITAEETTRGLGVSFQYCVKLFKKETIRRYMSYFKEIITGVLESPEKKIYQIDIIPGEEKNRLLVEFNDSETEYPKDKTIHRLFEEQVERTPDQIAVVGPTVGAAPCGCPVFLTYCELNKQSNNMAYDLHKKGVESGDIVGIKMERSIEMIVAMLGILKAGGTYLPIAQNYPQDRIDYMLKDSRAKLLITTDNFKEFPNFLTSKLPNFHLLPATDNRQPVTSLAYIIFTSGSTGRPKGVVIEHRNVVRFVKNPSFIETKEGQRLLMTGQYTFDIVTFEIWWPLLNGLILIQANENTVLNPDEMEKTVIINRIDILHLVPQLFKPMYTHNPGIFGRLSYFLVGGDLVAPREIRDLRKRYEKLKILHMYGPTEGATFSTCLEVGKSDESDRSLPIGKPVNNTTIYILGSHEEILPIGVVGELCVGGDGVARGYLNNPEMTAERFINPKLFVNTNTLYKTGDLSRWLDDGNIEFLGRKDYQVKIRGIRVELGEIENHLKAHDGIKEVVVVDRNENGRQYLCGYFVKELGAGEGKRWVEELKENLEGKLPPYMIPACFVEIDKIPLNANGKVDRKALPQPLEYDFHTGGKYEAPVNDLQRIIAEIWQDVLGREKVGIQDNFFDIGGNSLDFVKVGSKLKEKLNEEIAVVTLFTYPTISSLAHYLSRDRENLPENQRSQEIETLIDEGKGLIFQTLRKRDEGDSYE